MTRGFAAPFVLIGILALFLVLGGAYYLGKSSLPATTSPSLVTPVATPLSVIEPTAGWKTYSSSKFGFTLKYPPTLHIREGTGVDNYVYLELIEQTPMGEPRYYMYISNSLNPSKPPAGVKFTVESVGGYRVYTTDQLPSQSGALCKSITTDEITFVTLCLSPYNSRLLAKTQGTPAEQQELAKELMTFDQILSTFKFTQ